MIALPCQLKPGDCDGLLTIITCEPAHALHCSVLLLEREVIMLCKTRVDSESWD
jgi:hypothetical protein